MPSHARVVVPYAEQMPLFAKFQVESYLGGMFNPTVQLKSGGYIVIGITEALVAIDVNSGRSTREGSIEDTALKTNLEACDEVARQLRLRDLAGLIVIDFIDMEERKNNASVEKRLKDKLKTDRARIQVGRISGFGLMEMSRQRLRPGMLESTTQPCAHCHGTGLIRSDDSLGLQVLRALEEEGTRKRSKEVLLRAPIGIVNFLINGKREHIALIEARYSMSVRIECDPAMISPDFTIEKFKTATRVVPDGAPAISGNASLMGAAVDEDEDPELDLDLEDEVEEAEAEAAPVGAAPAEPNGTGAPGKKKRRRRRRKKGGPEQGVDAADVADGDDGDDGDDDGDAEADDAAAAVPAPAVVAAAPVAEAVLKKPTTRSRTSKAKTAALAAADVAAADLAVPAAVEVAKPKPAPRAARSRTPKAAAKVDAVAPDAVAAPVAVVPEAVAAAAVVANATAPGAGAVPEADAAATPVVATVAPEAAAAPDMSAVPAAAMPDAGTESTAPEDDAGKPKRRGWWSLAR